MKIIRCAEKASTIFSGLKSQLSVKELWPRQVQLMSAGRQARQLASGTSEGSRIRNTRKSRSRAKTWSKLWE